MEMAASPGCASFAYGSMERTNEHLLFVQILVRPDRRRTGIGILLLERATEVAEARGRSMVMTDTFDTIPAGACFAAAVGADVGIREHVSRVAVPRINMVALRSWADEGVRRAVDYDLIRWTDGYPDARLGDVAALFVMADEDMPFDDAAFEPITETAESLKMRLDASKPFVERVTTVTAHRSSGQLVGFSELIRRRSDTSTLFTSLTTVHRDHRGRGLGKWMKGDVITAAIARFPDTKRLQTENAFSNTAMLAINDAIGFVPQYTLTSYQLATEKVRRYLDR